MQTTSTLIIILIKLLKRKNENNNKKKKMFISLRDNKMRGGSIRSFARIKTKQTHGRCCIHIQY